MAFTMTTARKKRLKERARNINEIRSELGTGLFDLLDELQDKFDASSGHTHDGTSEDAPTLDIDDMSDVVHTHQSDAEGSTLTPGKILDNENYISYFFDFAGNDVNVTDGFWTTQETSATNSNTMGVVADVHGGEFQLKAEATSESKIATLYAGDNANFDIDKSLIFEARFKVMTTAITTNESAVIGMASDRADTLDNVAEHAWFKLDAAMDILLESDDGTNDNDDKDSTVDATAGTYNVLKIDFSNTSDVKFYIDGTQYNASTTFDMSNYTSTLQPIMELQKSTGATTPEIRVDYIKITCAR